jgi:hypothetical protein
LEKYSFKCEGRCTYLEINSKNIFFLPLDKSSTILLHTPFLENNIPGTIEMNSVRHISYLQGVYEKVEYLDSYCDCKLFRTFLPLQCLSYNWDFSIQDMLSKTKHCDI